MTEISNIKSSGLKVNVNKIKVMARSDEDGNRTAIRCQRFSYKESCKVQISGIYFKSRKIVLGCG